MSHGKTPPSTWIGDQAASSRSAPARVGQYDARPSNQLEITMAKYVDGSLDGPVVLMDYSAPSLVARDRTGKNLIFISESPEQIAPFRSAFPRARVVVADLFSDLNTLGSLGIEPASAILCGRQSFIEPPPIRVRLDFLQNAFSMLMPGGCLVSGYYGMFSGLALGAILNPTTIERLNGEIKEVVIDGRKTTIAYQESFVEIHRPSSATRQKLLELRDRHEVKEGKPLASVGFIETSILNTEFNDRNGDALPNVPSRYWAGVGKGTSKKDAEITLLAFLEEVYGAYMLKFRAQLRDYIFRNDRKLYRAINHYEKTHKALPDTLKMPTRTERVAARIERVAKQGSLEGLDQRERRSALGKLRRDEKPSPKH